MKGKAWLKMLFTSTKVFVRENALCCISSIKKYIFITFAFQEFKILSTVAIAGPWEIRKFMVMHTYSFESDKYYSQTAYFLTWEKIHLFYKNNLCSFYFRIVFLNI